jgi:hypothetical protein
MAAFINSFIAVPGAASHRPPVFATPRLDRRSSFRLATVTRRVGEILLFLWMGLALAFSFLVVAGFLLSG